MNKTILIFQLSILMISCDTKLLETDFKEANGTQDKTDNIEEAIKTHKSEDKVWDLRCVSFSGDYDGEIKFNTNFTDLYLLPNTITVKKDGQELTYRQIGCFISNPFFSTIPRLIKTPIKKHLLHSRNGDEQIGRITYRLIDKPIIYKTSKDQISKFYWATLDYQMLFDGKMTIDTKNNVITTIKFNYFNREYFDLGLSPRHFLSKAIKKDDKHPLIKTKYDYVESQKDKWKKQNGILDNSIYGHSLVNRSKEEQSNTYYSNYESTRESLRKGQAFSPIREPLKQQILEELFEFYFSQNHTKDTKLAPVFNRLICYDPLRSGVNSITLHQKSKFTDLETGEIQTAETSVKEIIEDRKGRKYPHRVDVIQKNANGDILTKYSITYQYTSK